MENSHVFIFELSFIKLLDQCFPNCVPLKRMKCAAKVLCFNKTLCCKYFWSALDCFGF